MKKNILIAMSVIILLMSASCADSFYGEDAKRISKDAEIILGSDNRAVYYSMEEIENAAELICIVKPVKNKGQQVTSMYDAEFGKELPGGGYTNFDVQVLEVFKGDIKVGDTFEMEQGYYVWEDEGKTQLVCDTGAYPLEQGKTYLMFLKYSTYRNHYYAVGDCEGLHIVPTKDILEKIKNDTLKIDDIPVRSKMVAIDSIYVEIYKNMMQKYFIKK